jgi:adenosylcobinamide amidohydrolase
LQDANGIMSVQVPKDCGMEIADEVHRNPEDFLRKEASKLNLSQDKVVGMMTTADLRKAEVTSRRYEDVALSALVTAGISFSSTAGDEIASKYGSFRFREFGTINIIVLIDGNLTESCMVDAVSTVIEAKTVALKKLDIRSRFSGDLASGMVTDSVVVACTKRGNSIKYAGTATMLGELISKSVKESVKKAINKHENLVPSRPLTKRLEERGISIADMTTLFSQARPTLRESAEKWSQFTEELQQVLSDHIIGSLVIACLRLDDDAKTRLIPVDTHDNKSVVCGILQTVVAD